MFCYLEDKLNKKNYCMGVPVLVVESLSENTRSKNAAKKLGLCMSCGVSEYWITNPLNKEVSIYLFADRDISDSITYKKSEAIDSFYFDGLRVELEEIFR